MNQNNISLTVGLLVVLISCSYNSIEPINSTPTTEAPGFQRKYGRTWFYYAQVNKQGDYMRRMFIDSASANAVAQGNPLPDRALIAMETWFGNNQSTVYIREKGSTWQSGSFNPGSPNYAVATIASCNQCHNRASRTDLTFTEPLLRKALQRQQPQIIWCNESSFNPCDLSVYQGE